MGEKHERRRPCVIHAKINSFNMSLRRYSPAAIAAIASMLLPLQTSAQNAAPDGVRILAADAAGITLEVKPILRFTAMDGGFLLPSADGALLANATAVGAPMQLRLTIPVALPGPTGSALEVLGVVYGDPVSGRIAPVPTLGLDALGMTQPRYAADASAYARSLGGDAPAELRYAGIARDVHSGVIAVAAYQFDGRSNRVRPVVSVRLRLRYGGAAANAGGNAAGRSTADARRGTAGLSMLTRGAFVNSDVAANWKVDDRRPLLGRRTARSAARAWLRVEVTEDGLYELTSDDFKKAGVDLAGVDGEKIAIYGADGGELDETKLDLDSTMHRIPAIVERNGSGVSRVLFYGSGPVRWSVRDADTLPMHRQNPYRNTTSYIVSVDGERGLAFPDGGAGGTPDVTLTNGIGRVFFEEDKLNAVDIRKNGGSGRDWFGSQFQVDPARPSDPRVFSLQLPGLDRSRTLMYRVRAANAGRIAQGGGPGTFKIDQRETAVGQFTIDGIGGERIAQADIGTFMGNAGDVGGDNTSLLRVTFTNGTTASGYLDWYEIHYTRALRAENDRISFWAPSGSGIAQFNVQDFSTSDLLGFDVTDAANPRQLRPSATDGRFVFQDRLLDPGKGHRYYIAARSAARRVQNVTVADYAGLRERPLDVDVLVITHPDFTEAAQKYVDHRTKSGLRAAYVTSDRIYNEFSGGNLDPTAIRNYISWAFHRWNTAPSYVLFIGDGSYDYRNIATRQKPLIPPYESDDGDIYDHIESTCFDDYFGRVTLDVTQTIDPQVDVALGRLPVETPEQAVTVVDKIVRYEEVENFGLWRTVVALAADDDYPLGDGGGFTRQSENLWRGMLPNWVDPKKIYIAAYQTEQFAARRKPGAEQDLLSTIERGAVITNWVGHGNPNVWAHEYILEKDKFISQLNNDSLLTYVPAVTCNFGYFDDPTQVSGGELFLLHPGGGAVAVMTATRAVYISPNEELMRKHFRELFTRDPVTHRFPTIGRALMLTKFGRAGFNDNDQKFMLFGDPAMQLDLPHDSVEITAINAKPVADSSVTVGALSQVTIDGVVRDQLGALRSDFDGTAIVSLYDADRTVRVPSGEEVATVTYFGGRLFRGPAIVKGGTFSITFRVPKDIAFDTASARLFVYAYNDRDDAAGMTSNVRVFGADTGVVTDKTGPDLRIYLEDRTFRSGDLVGRDPLLLVDLADAGGINSSGSSIGHRIEAWIDGDARSEDLTDTYQTLPTDYGQGTAERRLVGLEAGEHMVRVRAWDIYNNPSEGTAYFRIAENGDSVLQVDEVVNFPNPMARETDFLFRHNQVEPLEVTIGIYTTSGRKVRELHRDGVVERNVRMHWDGRDSDGAELANGVYLYRLRVKVSGDESGRMFETLEKVAIAR